MDKVQFEDIYEIDEIMSALDTFLEEHPGAREKETVKKLSRLLDMMYMDWFLIRRKLSKTGYTKRYGFYELGLNFIINLMKPVLKYPGVKNRIADWICSHIPKHSDKIEIDMMHQELEIQNKGIDGMKTKVRTIKINLSDTDCDLLAELCGKYGLTIESVFENFVEDLVDSDYSNGNDERFQITAWFNRCFEYNREESQKTLLYYLLDQYDVYEFIELVDSIEDGEQTMEDYKINAAQYSAEEIEFLKDNLKDWNEQYHNIMYEWIDRHPEADLEKEIENVRKWYWEKERIING